MANYLPVDVQSKLNCLPCEGLWGGGYSGGGALSFVGWVQSGWDH